MRENGFEHVDFGLPSGTMWATCNVGANSPFDYGLLFQFGRVDGYRNGDENNKFRTKEQNMQDTWEQTIPKTITGKLYGKGDTLDHKDDTAHVNMGGYWYNAYLWSSQVYSSYADFAYSPYFNSSGSAYVDINSRTFAFPIRGVFKK